jgi:probable HAF family extracellular repeat protein
MRRVCVAAVLVTLSQGVASQGLDRGTLDCRPVERDPNRVALVIGNSAYKSSPPLPNAANDAQAVTRVLERCLGFHVDLAQDLGRDDFVRRVRDFGARVRSGGIALFYYAGHGVEQDGRNYLIPAVHAIRSRADIPVEAYPIDDAVKRMEAGTGNGGVNVVIVDACRDNPLPAVPGEGRSFGWRSLAPVETQSGTLVMHSTRSGAQALDQIPGTRGRNSPFTTALLSQIVRSDITLRDLPHEVSADVLRLTGRLQEPWASASSIPPIRLVAGGGIVTTEPATTGSRLRIESRPAGARVFVAGRAVGVAPLEMNDIAEGNVLVRATLDGYQPAESTVTIRPGIRHEVQLVLTAIAQTSRLTVDTQPQNAEVRLAGGPAYRPGIELPNGEHRIEVSAPGFAPHRQTVKLERAVERIAIALTPLATAVRDIGPPQDIGGLPGATANMALAVNATGVVLGVSTLAYGLNVGFTWTAANGARALDSSGALGSIPAAINDRGDVVGTASNWRGEPRAVVWTSDGTVREITGLPTGQWSGAYGINSAGDVVGVVVPPGAFSTPLGGRGAGQRAFLRSTAGKLRWLDGLGGETAPVAINARGDVVGWSQDRAGSPRAVLWPASGGVRDLGTLGGARSTAVGINSAGQVVGWADNAAGLIRAFIWSASEGMRDLGTLGGQQSQAMGINDAGWVVGAARDASERRLAFIWTPDIGMRGVTTGTGATQSANGINNEGVVVGILLDTAGAERAFVALPQ